MPRRPYLVGTARYASIRGHEGQGTYTLSLGCLKLRLIAKIVQSARDDLESLGYMTDMAIDNSTIEEDENVYFTPNIVDDTFLEDAFEHSGILPTDAEDVARN